jgi:hypothetical protein
MISALYLITSKTDYGSGGGFNKSFSTILAGYFLDHYTTYTQEQRLKILDILLRTESLVSSVPDLFFNSLESISSIGELLVVEPILLYLYDSYADSLIPGSL